MKYEKLPLILYIPEPKYDQKRFLLHKAAFGEMGASLHLWQKLVINLNLNLAVGSVRVQSFTYFIEGRSPSRHKWRFCIKYLI